jgi:hypothetical protein
MGCDLFKGFLGGKKRPKVTIFWGKQKLNLPYLDHRFLYVASIMQGLKINIVSSENLAKFG